MSGKFIGRYGESRAINCFMRVTLPDHMRRSTLSTCKATTEWFLSKNAASTTGSLSRRR